MFVPSRPGSPPRHPRASTREGILVPGREAGPRRVRASGAGPAGGARAHPACVELGGCRRGGGGGGGTADSGPGSGNMSGEWRRRRCHPPGGAAAAARSGPCVPTPCGLPRGRSQAPEPWPWVFSTLSRGWRSCPFAPSLTANS